MRCGPSSKNKVTWYYTWGLKGIKNKELLRASFKKARLNDTIHGASKASKIRNCCGHPSNSKVKWYYTWALQGRTNKELLRASFKKQGWMILYMSPQRHKKSGNYCGPPPKSKVKWYYTWALKGIKNRELLRASFKKQGLMIPYMLPQRHQK